MRLKTSENMGQASCEQLVIEAQVELGNEGVEFWSRKRWECLDLLVICTVKAQLGKSH